jgi:hypothetical protein
MDGRPAAAQYADSAADVSPVDAQATARTFEGIWFTHRDEHGHAQILKGSGVRGAALLDSYFSNAEFPGQRLSIGSRGNSPRRERRSTRAEASGSTTSFPGPDPALPPPSSVEEFFPLFTRPTLKGRNVMANLEQAAAFGTSIKDFLEGIADTTP